MSVGASVRTTTPPAVQDRLVKKLRVAGISTPSRREMSSWKRPSSPFGISASQLPEKRYPPAVLNLARGSLEGWWGSHLDPVGRPG